MTAVELPAFTSCQNLVNGEWASTEASGSIEVLSPYTGGAIGSVQITSTEEVDQAIQAADAASRQWRRVPIKERSQVLGDFRAKLIANIDKMSHLAAAESGKTFGEAKAGVLKGIEVLDYALSLQNLDVGGLSTVSRGVTCHYQREALGVVAGIVPFNFPAMVPMWMIPNALALGNAFVLKPSEKVPLTSQVIGECLLQAGLPSGVFTLLQGDHTTAKSIVEHPRIQAVAFVGSTPVAESVYRSATSRNKRALCLGGAKNPNVILPDADPEVAVDGVVKSFTGCAGQRCMAASLLLAVGNCDDLIAKIAERAQSLTLGVDMGAVIDQSAHQRIIAAIEQAASDGCEIVVDGRRQQSPENYPNGFWLGPTIIDHAKPGMACAKTEIFGPVLTIIRVRTLDEALKVEQALPFGNACSVFTRDGASAAYVTENASAGMVGVNIGVPVPREPFSFGGTKSSKFGTGDITGAGSLDFWSNQKKITTKWQIHKDMSWLS